MFHNRKIKYLIFRVKSEIIFPLIIFTVSTKHMTTTTTPNNDEINYGCYSQKAANMFANYLPMSENRGLLENRCPVKIYEHLDENDNVIGNIQITHVSEDINCK